MIKKKKVARAKPEAEITNGTIAAKEPEPARKKKGGRQKAAPEVTAIAPTQDGNATLADVAAGYLAHMEEAGKSSGTTASYGMELKTAMSELGAETHVADLTAERVQEYFESPRVTKLRSGKAKAKPSIDKSRRVLRLALVWAAERGIIARAPIPEVAATH